MIRFPLAKRIFFFAILSLFFFMPPKVFASAEFETAYHVRYEVDTDGITHVTQEISLTNKLSAIYATRYSLTIEAGKIENIVAEDSLGSLETTVEEHKKSTTIHLTFNEKVVGFGKTLKFNLKYDNLNLASKNGQVWEITIPKLSESSLIDTYHLTLAIPKSFGEPAFITPNPISRGSEEGFNVYSFTKNQLVDSGGSAAFGEFQIFDFVLFYHLQNPEIVIAETTIALPPDTAYQQVFYKIMDPAPLNVEVDTDGNWLARYRLAGKEKLDILVSGKAKIFAQAQEYFLKPDQFTLEANLQPSAYWEVNDEEVSIEKEKLATPKDIYNFVVKTLDYNYSRVVENAERIGATAALKNPDQAICTEFTDLFIALCRSAGIPAREINGFAYTTNERLRPLSLIADILHAWPEYWDEEKQVWVPVDPTWGDTTGGVDYFSKLDLNHLAFVIHGKNSQAPYPAGTYKLENAVQKDIQVIFGKYEANPSTQIEVEFDLPKRIFAGFESKGKIIIKNTGANAIYNLPVQVNSQVITAGLSAETLPALPPFGNQEIEVRLTNQSWLKSGQGSLTVLAGEEEFVYNLSVESIIWHQILPMMGGSFAGAIFFLAAYKVGRLLVQKFRR